MVANMKRDGRDLMVFDRSQEALGRVAPEHASAADSIEEIGANCEVVFSMLPNDKVVEAVSEELLKGKKGKGRLIHISCSTISPITSRRLDEE